MKQKEKNLSVLRECTNPRVFPGPLLIHNQVCDSPILVFAHASATAEEISDLSVTGKKFQLLLLGKNPELAQRPSMIAINTIYVQHVTLWKKMYKAHGNNTYGDRTGLQLYNLVGYRHTFVSHFRV